MIILELALAFVAGFMLCFFITAHSFCAAMKFLEKEGSIEIHRRKKQ
jgi:hypothetical protein